MRLSRRRFIEASSIAAGLLAGCAGAPEETPTDAPADSPTPPADTPTDTPVDTQTATPTDAPTETPTQTAASTGTPTGLDGEITVRGSEWVLEPDGFRAAVGQELTITFENVGEVTHNLTVGALPTDERSAAEQAEEERFMAKTDTIQPEATTAVTFTPESTGTFPYWCDVPGHRDAGMLGEMTVVE